MATVRNLQVGPLIPMPGSSSHPTCLVSTMQVGPYCDLGDDYKRCGGHVPPSEMCKVDTCRSALTNTSTRTSWRKGRGISLYNHRPLSAIACPTLVKRWSNIAWKNTSHIDGGRTVRIRCSKLERRVEKATATMSLPNLFLPCELRHPSSRRKPRSSPTPTRHRRTSSCWDRIPYRPGRTEWGCRWAWEWAKPHDKRGDDRDVPAFQPSSSSTPPTVNRRHAATSNTPQPARAFRAHLASTSALPSLR
jgi:hypothetical protein